MSPVRLLVVGSGKIALDVAAYAVGLGHDVCLTSPRDERFDALTAARDKLARRLARMESRVASERISARRFEQVHALDVAAILEATVEDRAIKAAVARDLSGMIDRGALFASLSSSVLPCEIHPRAVGLHVFFPLAWTRLAELVIPRDSVGVGASARRVAAALDLRVLEQDEPHAFAVNRLLLPWQCEAIVAVRSGSDPAAVDRASRGPFAGLGALTMMDTVGLRIVRSAVQAYLERMEAGAARALSPLLHGLDALLARGEASALFADGEADPTIDPALEARLALSLVNGALRAADEGGLHRPDIDAALEVAVGAETSLDEAIRCLGGKEAVWQALNALHKSTGLAYFSPSPFLAP